MKRFLAAVILLAGIMAPVNENSIDEFRNKTHCKDVSVVTYHDGEVEFYGDSDGLYQIGSMTKAFTGLAIQKLISEGALTEDTNVSEVITGFTVSYNNEEKELTVENLLRQESGFTNSETLYPSAAEGVSLQDWAKEISGAELQNEPGTEYAYSNVNFNLLGAMIERITDRSYKDYMESEILSPLGLTNTYVGMPENEPVIEGTRPAYTMLFPYTVKVVEARIPAGYFYSNVKDMGRWLEIWLGDADIDDEFKTLIATTKSQLREEGDYYSGWECRSDGSIGHSGGTPNYSSRIVFTDNGKAGVCVLTAVNAAASTDSLCNGMLDSVTGKECGGVAYDVWTVFDIVFTIVTALTIIFIFAAMQIKSFRVLLISDIIIVMILVTLLIVLPMIFGADIGQILTIWAPYSLAGGMLALLLAAAVATVRSFAAIRYANRKKTS